MGVVIFSAMGAAFEGSYRERATRASGAHSTRPASSASVGSLIRSNVRHRNTSMGVVTIPVNGLKLISFRPAHPVASAAFRVAVRSATSPVVDQPAQ